MTKQRATQSTARHKPSDSRQGNEVQQVQLARGYLKALQAKVRGSLYLTRLVAALHSMALVGSVVLLAYWISASIQAGVVQWTPLLWVVLAIALRAGLNISSANLAQRVGEKAETEAREALAQCWCQADSGAATSTTERATLMVEPIEHLYGYYARFLPQLSSAFITPSLIVFVVFFLDWIAALFLLAAAPIIPLFMILVGIGAARLNQQHLATTQRIAGLFVDRVRHLTNLQLFKATQMATHDIAQASDEMRKANMATLRIAFLSSAVLEFFAAIAIAAVAIYVGFSLLGFYDWGPALQMDLFTGLTVLLLAPEFFQPLRNLSAHYHDRAAALAAAGLLATEEAAQQASPTTTDTLAQDSGLTMTKLTFAYPDSSPVLTQFNLDLQPGQVAVLHGPSGCGKSTLLKILSGQLIAQEGTIHWPAAQHIAYMAQQPYLQAGTIASNLHLIRPQASATQIESALEQAQLSLAPDYRLLEHGQGLSGGEQRRLALAKMFLHPSPLMLFDEPTAGLDAATADTVIQAIERLNDGTRILVIASHEPKVQALADVCIEALR